MTSDLEGNLTFFKKWGKSIGLLDENNSWSYGSGHLVILGDILDRGRNAYDLLWFIYHLELEAKKAGGSVHLLLGNHEQYGFSYVTKSVEAEHLWAIEQIMDYDKALSNKTVLGRWLRKKNLILKLNNILFLHGFFSKPVLNAGLTIREMNQMHIDMLDKKNETTLVTDYFSPTQYRGYSYKTKFYEKATQKQIDQTLEHFDVGYIITGHSKQPSIKSSFGGKVYIVDSTLSSDDSLIFKDGNFKIIQTGITRNTFQDNGKSKVPFDVANLLHWEAFFGTFKQFF